MVTCPTNTPVLPFRVEAPDPDFKQAMVNLLGRVRARVARVWRWAVGRSRTGSGSGHEESTGMDNREQFAKAGAGLTDILADAVQDLTGKERDTVMQAITSVRTALADMDAAAAVITAKAGSAVLYRDDRRLVSAGQVVQ